MKIRKRFGILFLAVILFCSVNVSANEPSYHWYCCHVPNHEQPKADAPLQFVEKLGGYYLDHTDEKVVYLTFDAGYENGNVEKILDTLKAESVPGAFFVLKNLIQRNPELVLRMVAEGHTVCNHTAHHPDLSLASDERLWSEIHELEDAYQSLTGQKMPAYYRPPEGSFSKANLETLSQHGYKTVFWSFAYADWDNNKQPSAEKALNLILDHLHPGEVLLLHPTSKTNAEILPRLIQKIKESGYRFGSLEELCR